MKKILLGLLVTVSSLSSVAHAEFDPSKGKLQGGGHAIIFAPDNVSSIIGAAGYIGYKMDIKDKISLIPEGRLGTGLTKGEPENKIQGAGDIKYGISFFYQFGAKAQYQIKEKVYINGGLAFSKYSTKVEVGKFSSTGRSNLELGFSFGGGYKLSDTMEIDARIDLIDKVNVYSVGVIVPL